MRRFLLLFLAVLIPALTASAQENVITFAPPEPAAAAAPAAAASPQLFGNSQFPDWQVALGFQFNDTRAHDQTAITNTRYNTGGINLTVVRYFNNWLGAEGVVGLGFGNTGKTTIPNNRVAKTAFFGGGPHISFRSGSHLEPWGHADVGVEHLRETQLAGPLASYNTLAWQAGGGVDWHLNERMAIRGEGDYVGTHFFNTGQRTLQLVFGFVFEF